jgi:hypothetical protein
MRKLKLEIDALRVETFEPFAGRDGRGTVHGHLSAYYEICQPGDTWQQSCTCEATCNAATCYNCGGGSAGCGTGTGNCCLIVFTAEHTCERDCL